MQPSLNTLFLAGLFFIATPAFAQGTFGIGGQVGDPTGLALKFGVGRGSVDAAVGWDLNDAVFGQLHYLLAENSLGSGGTDIRVFYGPGGFIEARDAGPGDEEDVDAGLSFNAGLSFYPAPEFEIFGQLTPRLGLIDETDFEAGGGIGLRYYP